MSLLYEKESYDIRGVCFEIYKKFYCNQKEKVYQNIAADDLQLKGYYVEKEKRINIYHNGKLMGFYVIDLVVNKIIMIEFKSKPRLTQQDIKQFWYYLKCTDYKLGFLINFGNPHNVEIIRKVYDTARHKIDSA